MKKKIIGKETTRPVRIIQGLRASDFVALQAEYLWSAISYLRMESDVDIDDTTEEMFEEMEWKLHEFCTILDKINKKKM
jgi:hypothetical protein